MSVNLQMGEGRARVMRAQSDGEIFREEDIDLLSVHSGSN